MRNISKKISVDLVNCLISNITNCDEYSEKEIEKIIESGELTNNEIDRCINMANYVVFKNKK